ncbi:MULTISPECIES: PIN domain-containing protein [unclassified Microbacterium]|uniref:type II toxin-antitoxin system VapC family toxin n=1 Tax=unclassified Microbacterium TaxID=2609290 RepID=UPI001605554A|nr:MULTISPECIES: PIN domain-containing protein [unclassified Microbacterium]QNA92659.1 PIN domain-containing protein [Microbacterium sp. Se63.02b]QYM62788.1 PIN domain-containing protein [Microbacterium sp. Se5.02b]
MIVVDAGVLIAHLSIDDVHQDAAFGILDTEEDLVIHPLTLAEALVHPARHGTELTDLAKIDSLGLMRREEPVDEPVHIARLRATSSLNLPDCAVLATAEAFGATLATFDRRLADVARARGVAVVGA